MSDSGKFWIPEYPYTEYYTPPVHVWIDAGVRKSWCKKCSAEGYWEEGKVVPIDKSVHAIYCKDRQLSDWYEYIGHTD